MRIRVAFCDAKLTLASVHMSPSWIEWMSGKPERDDIAVMATAGAWHWDSTGRLITDKRVVDALERARKEQA